MKDNQTLFFGDSGLVIYASEPIPDALDICPRRDILSSFRPVRDGWSR
jgi:hypothetical protein